MTRHPERMVRVDSVKTNPRNARTHSQKQIRQIADSIAKLGFGAPLLLDEDSMLLAGHGRLAAMKLLERTDVPAVVIEGLSPAQKRALLLADNKIADNAGWDLKRLSIEIPELTACLAAEAIDIDVTGFGTPEIDRLRVDFGTDAGGADDDDLPALKGPLVSKPGTLWHLGEHRVLCGDARKNEDLDRLMAGAQAGMVFADPPYNLAVKTLVGRGKTRHREFAMASGEMSADEFSTFLHDSLSNLRSACRPGAVCFVCMDWRHVADLMIVGRAVFDESLNLIVWVKSNAGQGSFYRSQHELIGVFRVGSVPHQNNVELGRHGRSRSNVWRYSGVNGFRAGRMDELTAHPTAKPVAMIADAIKDCTKRDEIVLDTFGGAGSTLMAAERVGRRAYVMEIEPRFVDTTVRRWQAFTGKDAIDAGSGRTFDACAQEPDDAGHPPARRAGGVA